MSDTGEFSANIAIFYYLFLKNRSLSVFYKKISAQNAIFAKRKKSITMNFKTLLSIIAVIGCCSCNGVTDRTMNLTDSLMEKTITRTTEEGEFNKFYDVTNFNGVEASGLCHIIYTQSESYSVKVSSNYEELIEALKVDKSDKKLKLDFKKKQNLNLKEPFVNVFVSAPVMQDVSLSGACGMTCDNMSVDSELEFNVSGAGNIKLGTVKCKDLTIKASGAIKMVGTFVVADDVKWESSGAAILDVDITADKIRFDNSGAVKMDAKVNCKKLKAASTGGGTMNLSGKAEKTDFDYTGGARINTDKLKN